LTSHKKFITSRPITAKTILPTLKHETSVKSIKSRGESIEAKEIPSIQYGIAPKFVKAKVYSKMRDGSEGGLRYSTYYEPCKFNPFE
jgi:hypothetical protein